MSQRGFSSAFAFAISSALSTQVDLREWFLLLVSIPPSTDLPAGTLFQPEVSHTTEASDFAPLLTSTGGTALITPSTGGLTRWALLDKDQRHGFASYALLRTLSSTGGAKSSTTAYEIPVMGK